MENNQIAKLRSEVSDITMFAQALAQSINGAEDERDAVMFLGRIKDNIKVAKGQFDFLTKPLKDHIKAIKAEYDAIISPLEAADEVVRAGIVSWRNSDEFKALEAKRIDLEKMAKVAVREGDIQKLEVIAYEHGNASEVAPKSVETSEANMRMRRNHRFEVQDLTRVPLEYLMINESAVKQALKDGKQIEGIRSWIEMTPTIIG